jgi:hypothetical protein
MKKSLAADIENKQFIEIAFFLKIASGGISVIKQSKHFML